MKEDKLMEMKPKPASQEAASPSVQPRPWVKPTIVEEDYSATETGPALGGVDGFIYS